MSTTSRQCCLVVSALFIFGFASHNVQAQANRNLRSNNRVAENASLKGMSAELEKHTRLLQRALARYMTSTGITPYIDSVSFWIELRDSRLTAPDRSPKDKAALHEAFAKLEDDVVQIMLDDQLALYQHELELNELQYLAIEKILRKDADAKVRLLYEDPTGGSFIPRLSAITLETEASIRKMLFAEQQRLYDKRQSEPRMIWTA